MIGRGLDNGRHGGGKAGKEHRYSRPAVDTDHFDEAKAGAYVKAEKQGEASVVEGSQAGTMDAPRGKIMGATVTASNGFPK